MTSKAAVLWRYRKPCLSLGFGMWGAAIAVAPTMTARAVLAAPALILPSAWWIFGRPGRWLAVFFAAALLLPPLPAPVGNTGVHPSLVVAAAGLLAGLLWLPDWRIPANALTGGFAAFFGLLLASVAQAAIHSGAEIAAGSLARVALFGISVYVFFYTVSTPAGEGDAFRTTRGIYWMAVAAALFACVDFYYQLPAPSGAGPQFVWLDSGVYRRAQGLFYEANTLGNFCSFFLLMIAVALARPGHQIPVSRKGLLAGGTVFIAALMLSYSRGSVANLLVGLAVLLWLNRKRIRWARVVPALAALGGLAAFLTSKIFPAFAAIYWLRISTTAEFLFSATEGVLSGRVASWRTLLDWLSASPWQAAVGIGYKTLPYSDYLGVALVADNMYLSLLVETGVLGLAALLWLSFAILRAGYRAQEKAASASRNSFFGAWILCFWCGQMAQMFFGDLLTYWRVLPLYFWVLAMAVRE